MEELDRRRSAEDDVKVKRLPGQSSRSSKLQNKPVEQLDIKTGKMLRRYASQGHAAIAMKCTQGVISYCCRGEKPHAYNFKWRFYRGDLDDFDAPDSQTGYVPIADLLKIRFANAIGFTRAKEAIKSTNATSWTTDAIVDDSSAETKDSSQPPSFESNQVKYYCSHIKPVEQLDLLTGKVLRRYLSGASAAKCMEGAQAAISLCCRSKEHKSCAYNFRWRFYQGPPIDFDSASYTSIEDLLKIRHGPQIPIPTSLYTNDSSTVSSGASRKSAPRMVRSRIVEQLDRVSGEVLRQYPTIKTACDSMQIPFVMMSACCRGHADSAGGYAWRFHIGPPVDCKFIFVIVFVLFD